MATNTKLSPRATYRDLFAIGEFRALWLAFLQSIAGDQLARVALTILVFQRTHSPLWTALTYAMTYLPWLLGYFLTGLADRLPRKHVMVTCDAICCLLVGVMAAPGMPLTIMVILIFMVTLLNAPFTAARAAVTADILSGDAYVLGVGVTTTTMQTGTVAGFALGGVAVAGLGPRPALAADAVTFGISALLLQLRLRNRPAAAPDARGQTVLAHAAAGLKLVFTSRQLRTLLLFGLLMPFYMIPEGLAVPYAARLGGGAAAAGLVFASTPLGVAAASALFGRLVPPARRKQWIGPLAICTCATLAACLAHPGLAASLVIFAASGAFSAYQLAANAAFVAAVPASQRGQAFGVAGTALQVSQALAFVIAGAAATRIAPAAVVAYSGIGGAAVACLLTLAWRRQETAKQASG